MKNSCFLRRRDLSASGSHKGTKKHVHWSQLSTLRSQRHKRLHSWLHGCMCGLSPS
jgi:hypothetical protein